MSHYGLRNKTELASFLGVSPQTVSNWYSRNSIDYDLVFEKCAGLDFNWLVTGNASVYGHRILEMFLLRAMWKGLTMSPSLPCCLSA